MAAQGVQMANSKLRLILKVISSLHVNSSLIQLTLNGVPYTVPHTSCCWRQQAGETAALLASRARGWPWQPWCFSDEFDSYIIVSFVNATLVLSIGETVEEVTDSGFLGTTPTLSCSQLGDDALVQVRTVGHNLTHWSLGDLTTVSN